MRAITLQERDYDLRREFAQSHCEIYFDNRSHTECQQRKNDLEVTREYDAMWHLAVGEEIGWYMRPLVYPCTSLSAKEYVVRIRYTYYRSANINMWIRVS